jgi:hypothetical protein
MNSQSELESWLKILFVAWSLAIIYINLFGGPMIADDPEERNPCKPTSKC